MKLRPGIYYTEEQKSLHGMAPAASTDDAEIDKTIDVAIETRGPGRRVPIHDFWSKPRTLLSRQ